MSSELARLLAYDPLSAAGDVTGRDYKEDPLTEALGVQMHFNHGAVKAAALKAVGDTTFSEPLDGYLRIIEAEGFVRVLDVPFEGKVYEGEANAPEHFYAYWKAAEAVLLVFDTWHGHVNGGKFYYNWAPHLLAANWHQLTSSGSMLGGVWAGDHDCREALRFHLAQLREHGRLVAPWARSMRPWMCHYNDTAFQLDKPWSERSDLFNQINQERIAMLPADVRAAILGDTSA